jgi:hypothetical protein
MNRLVTCLVAVAIASLTAGCQFTPTSPFRGFDEQGSRVVGQFEPSTGGSTLNAATTGSAATTSVQGIIVTVQERPSLTATVNQNGGFTLVGVPSGSFTLVFTLDGRTIGEIRLNDVRQNQGIRLSVTLTVTLEVVLIKEQRDRVAFSGECPRGPGFWCQNRSGKNPNLSASEFEEFARKAADMLEGVEELNTPEEISAAVCNTSNQFKRHLASLALNLAAKTVTPTTPLVGEQSGYATVGDAFDAAVAHLTGANRLSGSQQEALKDVMDRINNAQNIEGCDQVSEDDGETDDGDSDTPPPTNPPSSGQVTICHIPPGNANARHTLTIDATAWPAHQRHCAQGMCDYVGSCR